MQVVYDLIGGNKPEPIKIHYNGELAADSTTRRYAGSLVKRMDINDVDHGWFFTFGGLATALENTVGILAEDQTTSGNYLPDSATANTKGLTERWMYPIFPSTILRAEYGRYDAAGTDNTDTGGTGTAGSTTFSHTSITTADLLIGGWIYFVTGSAAGELHYITNTTASTSATFSTALTSAVAITDTFLVIWPTSSCICRWNATYTGFLSEIDDNASVKNVIHLMSYIQAPGIPLQPLNSMEHDGLIVSGARFFSDFVFCGATDTASGVVTNMFIRGETAA